MKSRVNRLHFEPVTFDPDSGERVCRKPVIAGGVMAFHPRVWVERS